MQSPSNQTIEKNQEKNELLIFFNVGRLIWTYLQLITYPPGINDFNNETNSTNFNIKYRTPGTYIVD